MNLKQSVVKFAWRKMCHLPNTFFWSLFNISRLTYKRIGIYIDFAFARKIETCGLDGSLPLVTELPLELEFRIKKDTGYRITYFG